MSHVDEEKNHGFLISTNTVTSNTLLYQEVLHFLSIVNTTQHYTTVLHYIVSCTNTA